MAEINAASAEEAAASFADLVARLQSAGGVRPNDDGIRHLEMDRSAYDALRALPGDIDAALIEHDIVVVLAERP